MVSVTLISFAALFLLLFIRSQNTGGGKLVQLSVLGDYRYSVGFIVNFLVSTVVMTSLVVSPFYLTIAFNLSLAQTGFMMASSPICVAIASFIMSRNLTDKNTRLIVISGVTLLTLGTSCLTNFNSSFGVIGYFCCLAITAVGYGTFTSSNNTQMMKLAPSLQRGQISGLLNLSRNLGLLSGVTLMSTLFELNTQLTIMDLDNLSAVETGLNRVYAFATLLLCIALILLLYQHIKEQQKNNI